ncbi:SpoIIAA-like anti-anti-sigma regulatory factor [Tumebacillus sp. BK434]|uniref:anti-sigma F factor antagonist n=1 Tax=Tumebacillus sp. BK434 TaxID=2512169 RepID=UPI001043E7F8|nr:anti-sigma F factor antagonist [Tumebacillus sp. BK434]TCP59548.1 SpoIIAA-like anti-anti-sigma regulatory factor [Tumebacillus sp. BK434]
MLQISTDVRGDTLIVRLSGELDHHTAEMVRSRVEAELDRGLTEHLVLNLEDLSFMDSSGLGVILGRYKRVTQAGGRMALCSVNDQLKKLFELSGMLKILRIYSSESQALAETGVA